MSLTRNNHYVPQWHQHGFLHEHASKLCHHKNRMIELPDGSTKSLCSGKMSKNVEVLSKTDFKFWDSVNPCFLDNDLSTSMRRGLKPSRTKVLFLNCKCKSSTALVKEYPDTLRGRKFEFSSRV